MSPGWAQFWCMVVYVAVAIPALVMRHAKRKREVDELIGRIKERAAGGGA